MPISYCSEIITISVSVCCFVVLFSLTGIIIMCTHINLLNRIMLYVYPLEAGWPPPPTQNLAQLSKLVMLCTHRPDMRGLITH